MKKNLLLLIVLCFTFLFVSCNSFQEVGSVQQEEYAEIIFLVEPEKGNGSQYENQQSTGGYARMEDMLKIT